MGTNGDIQMFFVINDLPGDDSFFEEILKISDKLWLETIAKLENIPLAIINLSKILEYKNIADFLKPYEYLGKVVLITYSDILVLFANRLENPPNNLELLTITWPNRHINAGLPGQKIIKDIPEEIIDAYNQIFGD